MCIFRTYDCFMFVKEIINIDKNTHDTDIIVTGGNFEILCCVCDYLNEDSYRFELFSLDYDDVYAISEKEFKISDFGKSKYNYQIHCRIIGIHKGIVELCDLKIVIDYC